MIRGAVPAALVLVACIHWLPAVGVLGGERLLMLYDVAADEVNLALLLRHRAVLFGVLGALLLAGAFVRALQWPALIAGLVSVGSFLLLAAAADSPNAAIQRVVVVDRWALVTLLAAMVVKVVVYRGGTPHLQL
ncbi:MAG: phosphopantetheine adenylyltransferase [Pseudomonadota bacterium]